MGAYSFKSSGRTREQQAAESLARAAVPIGIRTPLRAGGSDGIYAMNFTLPDQVHDNLRNLILTNWGERVGLYDLGANLKPLASEFATHDDFDAQAIERIRQAVERWMPYVSLEDFESSTDAARGTNPTAVNISITYTVPALQAGKRALQVTIYAL